VPISVLAKLTKVGTGGDGYIRSYIWDDQDPMAVLATGGAIACASIGTNVYYRFSFPRVPLDMSTCDSVMCVGLEIDGTTSVENHVHIATEAAASEVLSLLDTQVNYSLLDGCDAYLVVTMVILPQMDVDYTKTASVEII